MYPLLATFHVNIHHAAVQSPELWKRRIYQVVGIEPVQNSKRPSQYQISIILSVVISGEVGFSAMVGIKNKLQLSNS